MKKLLLVLVTLALAAGFAASTAQASVHLWLQAYAQPWASGQYVCQYAGWYNGTLVVRYTYPYGGCAPYILIG